MFVEHQLAHQMTHRANEVRSFPELVIYRNVRPIRIAFSDTIYSATSRAKEGVRPRRSVALSDPLQGLRLVSINLSYLTTLELPIHGELTIPINAEVDDGVF